MMLRLARSCVTRPAFVSSFRWNDSVFAGHRRAPPSIAPGVKPGFAGDDERAEHLQPQRLRECGQRLDDFVLFHVSTLVEI